MSLDMKQFKVKFSEFESKIDAEGFVEAAEEMLSALFRSNEISMTQYPSCEVIDCETDEIKIVDLFVKYIPLCYGKIRE